MPIRVPREATERDLYWEWVRAEVDVPPVSPRRESRSQPELPARLLQKLAEDRREELEEEEWTAVRNAYRHLRGSYLGPVLSSETRWSFGDLPITELGDVKVIHATVSFVPLAPSRRLEEFVRALDGGRNTPEDQFSEVYRRVRPVFDLRRVRGRPVLVSERVGGPYVLAEGLTRFCVLESRRQHRESVPASVPVLMGVTPQARSWYWYGP